MVAEGSPEGSAPRGLRLLGAVWHRWLRTPTATTVVLAVAVGFLLTAALVTGRETAEARQSRHHELVALVQARQDHVAALEEQLEELRQQLGDVEAAASPAGGLRDEVRAAEQAAGMTALAGPGVRLHLADADAECPTGEPADCRIRDRDLQRVVNTLFAAGAEAVAVNGERIVATSAVRNAGSAVLVNYRVLGAPYEVEAIGDPETLLARLERSDLAQDFEVWTDRYGLGFAVEVADDLTLPSYAGSLRTREARVAGGNAASAHDDDGAEPAERDVFGDGLVPPDGPVEREEEMLP